MTLQTLVVPLAGGFLGAAWGSASMLLYLIMGLLGLNVFAAASGGFGFFLAPTAGYLIGFLLAAAIVGRACDLKGNGLLLFTALLLSHVVIFACGIGGLMMNANMSLQQAFVKGVSPFLIGDALKIVVSYSILFSYSRLRR